ncbi:MAG TPA: MEDS domain-containing protein [Vicinamibacterales bacterium]|nr:MEDS domain-containing protein [Vicinamibacterales bacterium]
MNLTRGDHVCCLYSTPAELADTVADFVSDGLARRQQCWYLPSGDELPLIHSALQRRGVDVESEIRRGALQLFAARDAYRVRGSFDAEHAIKMFNDAIDQACAKGFTGFRAAADMSWALEHPDATVQLVVYEALLRSLFANCHAVGLCLYDRARMPLDVVDGALATHPVLAHRLKYRRNPFYDAAQTQFTARRPDEVLEKLRALEDQEDEIPS